MCQCTNNQHAKRRAGDEAAKAKRNAQSECYQFVPFGNTKFYFEINKWDPSSAAAEAAMVEVVVASAMVAVAAMASSATKTRTAINNSSHKQFQQQKPTAESFAVEAAQKDMAAFIHTRIILNKQNYLKLFMSSNAYHPNSFCC